MRNRVTSPQTDRAVSRRRVAAPAKSPTRVISLRCAVRNWLADGKAQGHSKATQKDREQSLARFCWWLENEAEFGDDLTALTPALLRDFFTYAREPRDGGRYGSERTQAHREARPATVNAYYRIIRAWLNFCAAEGLLRETPLHNIRAPRVPDDQIIPFREEQVQQLLDACRSTQAPERDTAITLLLLDSGMRVSELCPLLISSVDRGSGELTVIGKGNKKRQVYLGKKTRRALWRYLESDRRDAELDEPLLTSVGGHTSGAALTTHGVRQLLERCGEAAGITGVRCSPHTLRHTFAVNFLRNGGNLFELQMIMGHTDLKVLRKYVLLAEADLALVVRQSCNDG